MKILGLNAYHGDSSACIIADGNLLAAVEEERFTRIKHWAGFPKESIRYCLREADVTIEQIDHIAINRNGCSLRIVYIHASLHSSRTVASGLWSVSIPATPERNWRHHLSTLTRKHTSAV